jgi:hypothetical protein
MLGRGKTSDLPTGGQETQSREDPQPRPLHQKRHLFDPRVAGGKPTEFCFALLDQRFKGLVQAHRLLDPEFLGKRQIQSQPPFSLVDSKRCAWRRIEMVALKNTVQTILSLRSRLYQSVAMRHQSTQLAHCLWRHPHRRNEMGRKSSWPI